MLKGKTILFAFIAALLLSMLLVGCESPDSGDVEPTDNDDPDEDVVSDDAEEEMNIQLGHCLSPTSHYQLAADEFARLIEERTDGRISVEVFPASQLGDERELVEGMDGGFIDASIVSTGLYGGFVDELNMLDIPFLFSDLDHVRRVFSGDIGQQFTSKIEDTTNIVPLTFLENGFRHMTNSVRPIRTPEDIVGLSIRNPAWPTHVAALEALGAEPQIVDFSDLYMALERGAVDGQHNPIFLIESSGFQEVQDHMSIMDWSYGGAILSVSEQVWSELSDNDRNLFLQVAQEVAVYQDDMIREMEDDLLDKLRENMEIVPKEEVETEAFQQILEETVYPEYIEEYGELLEQIIDSR